VLILLTLVDDEVLFAGLEENLGTRLSEHRLVAARDATGIASGYNALVERAAAGPDDILCFVHQDVRFLFDAAAVLPRAMDALDDVGVLGFAGSAAQLPGRPWYDCPPRYGGVVQGAAGDHLRFAPCHRRVDGLAVAEVHTVDGLALVIRAATLAAIGGFDEGCPGWHGYDLDLCLRARSAGLRNVVLDQPVHHLSSGTSDDDHRRSLGWMAERWSDTAIGPMLVPAPEPPRRSDPSAGPGGGDDAYDRLILGHDAALAGAWGTTIECLAPLVDGTPDQAAGLRGAERGVAAMLLSFAHDAIGSANPVVAPFQAARRRHWLLRAADESPQQRGPWIELASSAWEHGDADATWAATAHALGAGDSIPRPFDEPSDWDWMVHDLRSLAAWARGERDEAQRHAYAALAVNPGHPRLARNHLALARATRRDGVPLTWRHLDVLVPAALVRGRRVALVGESAEASAYLTSCDPSSLALWSAGDVDRAAIEGLDLVLVETSDDASPASTAARHLHRWWAALAPGAWFCGRDHDPARVTRLVTTMYLRHGVRSAADGDLGDVDPSVWAMRAPDRSRTPDRRGLRSWG